MGAAAAALCIGLSAEAVPLRVVTYNVALGLSIKAEAKLKKPFLRRRVSIRSLFKNDPALRGVSILGLQEACTGYGGAHLEYFRNVIGQFGGMVHAVHAPANPTETGGCAAGQMILSRYPIVRWGQFQLPLLRPGGKVALWADLEIPDEWGTRTLRVYNVHLDNRGESFFAEEGRWRQMLAVLEHYEKWRENHPENGVIFLGDFNALNELYNPWDRERTIEEMLRRFDSVLEGYRPTHISLHQLDWIFFTGPVLEGARRVVSHLSDHLPVSADFQY